MAKRKHNLEENHLMTTSDSEQCFMALEPFQPTDQELVTHLRNKRTKCHVPMNSIIYKSDAGGISPDKLLQMFGFANQKEMYFFAGVTRGYLNGSEGYWKRTSSCQCIKEGNEIIGYKRSFRYFIRHSTKDSTLTNWAMVEHRTQEFGPPKLPFLVLLKMYEKKPNAKNVAYLKSPGKACFGSHKQRTITWPSEEEVHQRKRTRFAVTCSSSYPNPRIPELPFEIIVEILSWLPVQSLLRFMCACKRWCSLIQDHKFIAEHMDRVSRIPISYRAVWTGSRVANFYDENFSCISSFGGLFLEMSAYSEVFRIRNVARHQVLYLPYTQWGNHSMDFTLNKITGECKVACFYCKEEESGHCRDILYCKEGGYGNSKANEVGFKVMTIGKDAEWRLQKLPKQNDNRVLRQRGKHMLKRHWLDPDKVKGFAHLVEIIRDGQELYLEIQSFDVWSECCSITTLPPGVFSDLEKVSVIRWNHCLAVAEIADNALNVLVLEDSREDRWSKKKVIVPLEFLKDSPLLEDKIVPVRAGFDHLELRDGVPSLVFHEKHENRLKNIYEIDMEGKIIRKLSRPSQPETRSSFYEPSLLTLKGMRLKIIKTNKGTGE